MMIVLPSCVMHAAVLLLAPPGNHQQPSPSFLERHSRLNDAAKATLVSILLPAFLATSATFVSPPAAAAAALIEEPLPSQQQLQSKSVAKQQVASKSSSENYLPRKLYPGTYKNFCGPTPEVTIKGGCQAHGWHGDDAQDEVDGACQLHDISYCNCESQLMSRKKSNGAADEQIPFLSSLVAVRFLYETNPDVTNKLITNDKVVDEEYVSCVHQADQNLLTTGIKLRSEQQRTNCASDPSSLGWFCRPGGDTLDAFEKVNLNIFLRNMDADSRIKEAKGGAVVRTSADGGSTAVLDPSARRTTNGITLTQLEQRRNTDLLNEIKSGKTVSDAASSGKVGEIEEQMLRQLSLK